MTLRQCQKFCEKKKKSRMQRLGEPTVESVGRPSPTNVIQRSTDIVCRRVSDVEISGNFENSGEGQGGGAKGINMRKF